MYVCIYIYIYIVIHMIPYGSDRTPISARRIRQNPDLKFLRRLRNGCGEREHVCEQFGPLRGASALKHVSGEKRGSESGAL